MICRLPSPKGWSSILHAVILIQSSENLEFACRWLCSLNVDIGKYEYNFQNCSFVYAALCYCTGGPSVEKANTLLEFGATLPDTELCLLMKSELYRYGQVKEFIDEKRDRVTRATLVILSMHRSQGKVASCCVVSR